MNLINIPVPVEATPATPPLYFTWGSYESKEWRIPFLSTSMKFEDAAELLNLAEDIPGMNDIGTSIQELYQRQIDWHKVATGLAPYLRDDSAKFMNALTVVLAPRLEDGGKFTAYFGDNPLFKSPDLPTTMAHEMTVGPIKIGFPGPIHDANGEFDADSPNVQIGQIRWNPKQVYAVAIDGQHRLAGIRDIMNAKAAKHLKTSRVPVLFILLDEKIGAKSPTPIKENSLQLVRKIFTDLNKHAVKPSRARLILLDDDQPLSLCVKALMDDKIAEDLGSLSQKYPRLPLSIVDWITEQAKVDSWPFITSVLNLDWLVAEALGIKEVKTMMDYQGLRSQILALSKTILLDKAGPLKEIESLDEWKQTPFQFGYYLKQEIVDKFRAIYSKPIVDLFINYSPYRELIALRTNDGSLSNIWQQWFKLKWRAEKLKTKPDADNLEQYELSLINGTPRINPNEFKKALETIEDLKVQNRLAYTVVFQKAYFSAFLKLKDITRSHYEAMISSNSSATVAEFDEVDWDDDSEFDFPNLEGIGALSSVDYNLADLALEPESVEEEVNAEVDVVEQDLSTRLSLQVLELAEEFEFLSEWFISFMNKVFGNQSELLQPDYQFVTETGHSQLLWKGSIGTNAGNVDFTKVASDKASELLEGAALLYCAKSRPQHVTKYDTFESLWADIIGDEENVPKVVKRLRTNLKALTTKTTSIGARILNQLDLDYDSDVATDHIRWRLSHIWGLI